MTKTTANLRLLTIAELRDLVSQFQARIDTDANDTAAGYNLDRVNTELSRRQRLCRAEHLIAGRGICALLIDHAGDHRALNGEGWA